MGFDGIRFCGYHECMPVHTRKHIYKDKHFNGMHAFYVNALMRGLVFALVGIFTPVFIYRTMLEGHGVQTALLSVVGFYFLIRLIIMIVCIPLSKVIERLGFRWSVMVSLVFLAGYLGGLLLVPKSEWWLVFSAVMSALNIPFYWIARHSVIAQDSSDKNIGKQIGLMSLLENISGVLGPVAGGLIIMKWGFGWLYAVALVILVFSVLPLFLMPHHIHRNGVSLHGYLMWIKGRQFFHQAVSFVGRAINNYSGVILWPLAVSMMGIDLSVMGGIFSLVTGIAMLVRYFGGILFDKLHDKGGYEDERVFGLAAVGESVSWILRIFVGSALGVVLVDGIGTIFGTSYRNFSDDYTYLGGKRMSEIAFFTYREVTMSLGIILLLAVMGVGVVFGAWKELVFVVTAVWVLISIVQARESNIIKS